MRVFGLVSGYGSVYSAACHGRTIQGDSKGAPSCDPTTTSTWQTTVQSTRCLELILSLYPIATPYVPIILGFVARSQMKERPAMGLRNEEVAWQSPRSLLVSSGRLCSSCG